MFVKSRSSSICLTVVLVLFLMATTLLVGAFAVWACDTGSDPKASEETYLAVRIIEVLNGRKNTVGNFDQEPDPHKPMRLFVDTRETWNGQGLVADQYDKQRAKITVEVIPNTTDPTKYYILWEIRDPDDPATHTDIDANGHGGDNTGKDHEGDKHWFTQADHTMSNIQDTAVPKAERDENTVLGSAKTDIVKGTDGKLKSTAMFNYSDHGGDNFILSVTLKKKDGDKEEGQDKTDVLTVWRKRWMNAHAMASDNTTGVFDAFPAGGDRFTALRNAYANADANKNCYIDLVCADASGPGPRPESGWKLGFGATCIRSPIRPAFLADLT